MRLLAGFVTLAGLSLLAACELPFGDSGDDAPASRCAGLDLQDCRADSACVADTCLECSCTPVFVGCRAATDPVTACPELGCAQPECCADQEQCTNGGSCQVEPGPFCGACMPGPGDCTDDRGCTGGQICEPIECSCEGAHHCSAGCETTGCDLGEVCDGATHRCVEAPCTEARTECPPNFVCTWPEGGCMRKNCTSDGNCETGFCVNGFCEESLGVCFIPPP